MKVDHSPKSLRASGPHGKTGNTIERTGKNGKRETGKQKLDNRETGSTGKRVGEGCVVVVCVWCKWKIDQTRKTEPPTKTEESERVGIRGPSGMCLRRGGVRKNRKTPENTGNTGNTGTMETRKNGRTGARNNGKRENGKPGKRENGKLEKRKKLKKKNTRGNTNTARHAGGGLREYSWFLYAKKSIVKHNTLSQARGN